MSLNFYAEEEGQEKEESLNKYWSLCLDYIINPPNLPEALKQMFISAGAEKNEIKDLIEDIESKCEQKLTQTFEEIKKKYPNITKDDALIISSYTCESKDKEYSPYRLLNTNMVEKNRKKGIENISKYLYILLHSLRKLKRYYPDKNSKNKYLYRCIRFKVNLKEDPNDSSMIPYANGNIKTFWGFTSSSPYAEMTYDFLGKKEKLKSGTRFTLTGYVWRYDITLFNCFNEEEILIEPERKFRIDEVKPEVNEIIDVRCEILETPLIFSECCDPDTITIRYKIDEEENKNKEKNRIQIFGDIFVENNSSSFLFWSSSNLKIIHEEKEYKLKQYFELKNSKSKKILEIKLKGINNIKNMSYMFYNCTALLSLHNISNMNTSKITDMKYLFNGCKTLKYLPDISKWDTSNVTDMRDMFSDCESLKSLPDISKWDTSNVTDMRNMFYHNKFLSSLPDISKWNTSNVTNMRSMFGFTTTMSFSTIRSVFLNDYSSLSQLPDISKWDTSKVTDMSEIFAGCVSLQSLPDISKWNTSKVKDINHIFYGCKNISSLPDISKWKTNNIRDMNHAFCHCNSLKTLPDVSKWDLSKVEDMRYMFNECDSLKNLPNISKWNISNVKSFTGMFYGCTSLSSSDKNYVKNWSDDIFKKSGCLII